MISDDEVKVVATLKKDGREITDLATGNGLVAAFCKLLEREADSNFQIVSYHQHALTTGRESKAISYIMIKDDKGQEYIGAGISGSISKASLRAVVSAVNNRIRSANLNK